MVASAVSVTPSRVKVSRSHPWIGPAAPVGWQACLFARATDLPATCRVCLGPDAADVLNRPLQQYSSLGSSASMAALATFPPAPRLRCHRAAKPPKGFQPMDLGQFCPEVGLNGVVHDQAICSAFRMGSCLAANSWAWVVVGGHSCQLNCSVSLI